MKKSSQLSDVLHVLLHMAEGDGPSTSDTLATAMGSHPVVLRRLMGGLRDAGLVTASKGHGGGWLVSSPLGDISLRDVHTALGSPPLVSLGFREDRPECLVAQVVNESLQAAMQEAELALLARLEHITLAELSSGFHQRMLNHPHRADAVQHRLEDHHG